ncbi:MAG: hypothetical protein ACI8U3_001277 [Brevundimonas sp.]|jgi:hypothetical protein|uniref:hypothetical protein n=1 Tax=Brevundimonas sp. TaxID=1871086 RepID=UPI0039E239DA
MKGSDVVEAVRKDLKKKGEPATDRAVAERLGITVTTLANWKARDELTAVQVARLLASTEKATEKRTHEAVIRPVVEFFEIQPEWSRGGANVEIFSPSAGDDAHPYLAGLKAELLAARGVYLFYDSRGRALYAGQARSQSLWKEINLAFNRDRGVQKIRRVNHPVQRQDFRTFDEMRRQIRSTNVRLYDLAAYVSAWRVADGMICDLEALLIRAFPNDLLNTKMENFG